jgi:hypothetical protein
LSDDFVLPSLRLSSFLPIIASDEIRNMTVEAFKQSPDYFWTLPCSVSGKYHGGESLVDHVATCCLVLTKSVWQQVGNLWNPTTKDLTLSAMLLHDCWRCGYPGKERRYNGNIGTDSKHPEIGAEMLRGIWGPGEHADRIAEMVEWHYGPWGIHKTEFLSDQRPLPWWDPRIMIHTIDAHNAWNSQYIKANSAN